MTNFTNQKAIQILKEEQAANDAFFAEMDAKIAKAQDNEFETPKTFEEVKIGCTFTWGTINPVFVKISEDEAVRHSDSLKDLTKVIYFAKHCKVNRDGVS